MSRSRDIAAGSTRVDYIYTATANQTTFTGSDSNSNTLSYTAGLVEVFLNGTRLSAADFTATNGTSVVLASGADVNDIINIVAYGVFSVADRIEQRTEFDYTATSGQTTFSGNDNDGQSLSYTVGKIDVYLNGSHLNVTDDYVASNGTSVVLQSGATTGDILHIVNHGTTSLIGNFVDGETLDVNGNEIILDADGDTSITADTDDQIDFKLGGTDFAKMADSQLTLTSATASRPGILLLDTNADANPPFLRFQKDSASPADNDEVGLISFYADDDGGNVFIPADIKVTAADVSNGSEDGSMFFSTSVNGTKSEKLSIVGGNVGIGTTSPSAKLQVVGSSNTDVALLGTGGTRLTINPNDAVGEVKFKVEDPSGNNYSKFMTFHTEGGSGTTERMRINPSGDLLVGSTDGSPWNNTSSAGVAINAVSGGAGLISCARVSGDPLAVNRVTDDGNVIAIYAQGAFEGSISVSGNTVSYNAFTGSHWSRLSDNSKPTILRGTVMETIDTMCDWYELVFKTSDNIDKITEIALPEGKSVGDSYTMEYMGETVTGTIRKKSDNKHCMSKISDTEDSASIYGVFMNWNTETDYNDMYINALGTSLVRVASGVTVSKGDLLSSKGDGTAKLQGDDIIRTKTIGKVLSNVKQQTYDDGSFTVACALYCG